MELTKESFERDWKNFLNVGLKACRLGREVLLTHFGRLEHIEEKEQAGLVSEADKESEEVIKRYLKDFNPQIGFLGEESAFIEMQEIGPKSQAKNTAKPATKVIPGAIGGPGQTRWILDPLDGTTNYVHRFPIFCVSLGLEVQGELVLGVIDMPALGETYTAVKGHGAFVNGKRMKVSSTSEFKNSLLATGFFPTPSAELDHQISVFAGLVKETRGIRRAGAAAYDLCQVARGVFDGFWEKNLQAWDSAAGVVLVREAGGVVVNYRGEDYTTADDSLI
ncbi:MAG: inositol monophosphatase family protein, partial [Bdellovibrionota bacterium]